MPEIVTTDGHTPGPWELQDALHRNEQYTIGVRGTSIGTYVIASVDYGYTEPFESQQHANARLIAAAPELLAALKDTLDKWVELVNSGDAGNWCPDTEEHVIAARAAIAKAEGRS